MIYKIYKLRFNTPVHFGKNSLEMSDYTLCSDSLFSALCVEAAITSSEQIEQLVAYAKNSELLISDALPYFNEKLFVPKPYLYIEREQSSDSSIVKKAFKKLSFIAADDFDNYLNGTFDVMTAPAMRDLGVSSVKISASIRNDSNETKPYEVGLFSFNPNCGLYIIFGMESEEVECLVDNLMSRLTFSGLGGERSSGYGRFIYDKADLSNWFIDRLTDLHGTCMLLNTALPSNEEFSDSKPSGYGLVKRGGFVTSYTYSDSWQRKKDVFMYRSGSCFEHIFKGDVFNVSDGSGRHPVYRYGIPLLMRINL